MPLESQLFVSTTCLVTDHLSGRSRNISPHIRTTDSSRCPTSARTYSSIKAAIFTRNHIIPSKAGSRVRPASTRHGSERQLRRNSVSQAFHSPNSEFRSAVNRLGSIPAGNSRVMGVIHYAFFEIALGLSRHTPLLASVSITELNASLEPLAASAAGSESDPVTAPPQQRGNRRRK